MAVSKELRKEVYPFLKKLITSAIEREKFADEIIREVTENWELERIAAIDRNILRLGIAEFLDFPDISPRVTIDEAIELAKEFGDQDSSKFVNGVLDAALRKLRQLGLVTKD
ncbi:MAG TPA: transcription antitermination factor NusB [candidate division Zixibacteria bacterium]|nr:transcription antitermination factor NusB [candidate division Zixibacteria bacterium]